jgi:hypothetical protein
MFSNSVEYAELVTDSTRADPCGEHRLSRTDVREVLRPPRHQIDQSGTFGEVSPRLRRAYEEDPAWAALPLLSSGASLNDVTLDASAVASRLFNHGVRHVVVDGRTATADLLAYVSSMHLQEVARNDGRTLYRIVKP